MPPEKEIDSYIEKNVTASCRKLKLLSKYAFILHNYSLYHSIQKKSSYIEIWCKLLCWLFFLNFLANDEVVINRDCQWKHVEDECFYNAMPDDIQMVSCAICDSDGCNGEPKNSSETVLLKSFKILSVLSFLLCHSLSKVLIF